MSWFLIGHASLLDIFGIIEPLFVYLFNNFYNKYFEDDQENELLDCNLNYYNLGSTTFKF